MPSGDPALSTVTADLDPRPAASADTGGAVRLGGSRCQHCTALACPARAVCHRCGQPGCVPVPVSPAGQLYSWSTVHVSGSRPVPYTLGYIDLPEGLRVLALLADDPGRLSFGAAMRLAAGSGQLIFELAAPAQGGAG